MSAPANASPDSMVAADFSALAQQVKEWGRGLGFQQVGVSTLAVDADADQLDAWLAAGFHGEMDYMARNTDLRRYPERLVPGAMRAICVRMDYRPQAEYPDHVLNQAELGYVARYALGRDYHKVLRKRLQQLARRIADAVGPHGYRVFTDSAPVLEKALARQAGLGLDRQAHQSAGPAGWVVVFPRRDPHRPAATGGPAGRCPLRELPGLHRHLPHPGHRRALSPRRAAVHQLPHHRAQGRHSRDPATPHGQPDLWLR